MSNVYTHCNTHADRDCYVYRADPHPYSDTYSDSHTNCYTDTHADRIRYSYVLTNEDTNSNAHLYRDPNMPLRAPLHIPGSMSNAHPDCSTDTLRDTHTWRLLRRQSCARMQHSCVRVMRVRGRRHMLY